MIISGRSSENEITAEENSSSENWTVLGQNSDIWKGTLAGMVDSAAQKPALISTVNQQAGQTSTYEEMNARPFRL